MSRYSKDLALVVGELVETLDEFFTERVMPQIFQLIDDGLFFEEGNRVATQVGVEGRIDKGAGVKHYRV